MLTSWHFLHTLIQNHCRNFVSWLLSQSLLRICSVTAVSARNRVLQWALLKKRLGWIHSKLFQAKYCLPIPQLELQLWWCLKDLHVAACATRTSFLWARGAHAYRKLKHQRNFPESYFSPAISKLTPNPIQHHAGEGSVLILPIFLLRTSPMEKHQLLLLPLLLPVYI